MKAPMAGTLALLLVAVGSKTHAELRFTHHFADRDMSGASWGQTALADLDRDGDLDFVTGRSRGDIYWYEYQAADKWVRHKLGEDSPSDVGGAALDVNGDGWMDLVTGGAWYENPKSSGGRPLYADGDLSPLAD